MTFHDGSLVDFLTPHVPLPNPLVRSVNFLGNPPGREERRWVNNGNSNVGLDGRNSMADVMLTNWLCSTSYWVCMLMG